MITGCRINKGLWLTVDADADDLRLCGLPLPIGMKDVVCRQLLRLRAKNISIRHNAASSHAIVRFSLCTYQSHSSVRLVSYMWRANRTRLVLPFFLVWFNIYTISTRLERNGTNYNKTSYRIYANAYQIKYPIYQNQK